MSGSNETLMALAHKALLLEYLPIIVFMAVITVIGIAGNIITYFFFKTTQSQTSTVVFIQALALVDLIVCILAFTTIADLAVNIRFTNRYLCKTMYFLDQWTILTSIVILWLISVDRYLKVCRPLGKQVSVRAAIASIVLSVLLTLIISVRDFVTYDVVLVNVTASDLLKSAPEVNSSVPVSFVVGHYCTGTDDIDRRSLVMGFHIFDTIAVLGILLTFIFTYGNIVCSLTRHKRKMAVRSPVFSETSYTGQTSVTKLSSNTLRVSISNPDLDSTSAYATSDTENKLSRTNIKETRNTYKKVKNTKQSERSITIMMLAVSIGFAVCFTPYFIVSVGVRILQPGKAELDALTQFAVRSPFWNSVINPILFCVFNPRYRNFVKRFAQKCKRLK